jgi:Capsule assembly protein Wzi
MQNKLFFLIIVILLVSGGINAQHLSIEPTDSWVYNSLNLINHYLIPDYFTNQKPFLRSDIGRYINSAPMINLGSPVANWEYRRISDEFSSRISDTHYDQSQFPIWIKISPYSLNTFSELEKPLYRIGIKTEAVINFYKQAFVQIRGRLENKGNLDSFAKARKWEDKLTGYLDYALLGYQYRAIRLTWGRTFRTWGPKDNDRLLISTNSPPFDQISLQAQNKRFAFQYWTSQLDYFVDANDNTINRYFAAHRLAFKPHRRLEIGLSETVLYGRINSGWELYYLNPLLPFYWEQYNNRVDDNIYWGLDFSWIPWNGLKLYGELLIDDFQIDFVSEAHQVGFNLGFSEIGLILSDYLQIEADYTQIRNTVYGQNKFYNVFANNGIVIGSSLGTDSDRLRYKLTWRPNQYVYTSVGGSYRRKGEGRYYLWSNDLVPKGQKFPSGIVEKQWDNYIRVDIHHNSTIFGDITIGYADIENFNNQKINTQYPYILVNFVYHLKFKNLL